MTKKLKNTPGIGRKIIDRVNWNKREVLAIVIVFIVLVILISIGLYRQYAANSDKNNVIKMRVGMARLVGRINDSGMNIVMDDKSRCIVHKPRLFGETSHYSCQSDYVNVRQIEGQNDLESLVMDVTAILKESDDLISEVDAAPSMLLKLSDTPSENSYYNATSFLLRDVRLSNGPCFVRYEVLGDNNKIKLNLECSVKTERAYFEPIDHE